MPWANLGELFEWFALNVGPAIPFIFSGGFSVWALVLKMKTEAARRAEEVARDAREEARRKEDRAEREASALRLENEKVKTAAFEKAERLLNEERERSASLLADKIQHMSVQQQSLTNELAVRRMQGEKDAMTIERLNERNMEASETLEELRRDNEALRRRDTEVNKRIREVQTELQRYKDEELQRTKGAP